MPANTIPEARVAADHWDLYWASGAQGSFELDGEDDSGTAAVAAWEPFFAALPDASRHLDVGCGNGGVSLVAARVARRLGRTFRLHAVDLAEIHPERTPAAGVLAAAGIDFRGGVDLAALPFADASFDAVTGQYALEYADPERAPAEILRVLGPGGRARFVVHHADSLVLEKARDELPHIDWLIGESGLTAAARDLLARIVGVRDAAGIAALQSDPRAEALRLRFNAVCDRVSARIAAGGAVGGLRRVLGQLGQIIAGRALLTQAQAAALIDEVDLQLRGHRARLGDLLASAHDGARMAGLLERLRTLGARDPSATTLHHPTGALMGWQLDLSRS
jgi:SAM-dependent methyltransferase